MKAIMSILGGASSSGVKTLARYEVPSVTLNNGKSVKRVINGLWQTAGGGWDVESSNPATVEALADLARAGFTTFDGADIYGPAEDLMGRIKAMLDADISSSGGAPVKIEALTKFVPRPGAMSLAVVESAVMKSFGRMGNVIDNVQFHWWEYGMEKEMLNGIVALQELRKKGVIAGVGLTNFDTRRVRLFVEHGVSITSNQVQFSVIDSRPTRAMAPYCKANGVFIFAYGSILGGFLSDAYIGVAEPNPRTTRLTPSKTKYLQTINQWGSWALFQEMLRCLRRIGDLHGGVSVSNVGARWVLQQEAVASVIIGVRPGKSDHTADNAALFGFELTEDDLRSIAEVQKKGNDLFDTIGDCGDEYR